jgi:hypothetical protein
MDATVTLPQFVVLPHTWREQREALQDKLDELRTIPAPAPLAHEGEIGVWHGIGIALYYPLSYLYGKKAAGLYVISDMPIEGEAVWRTGFRRDEAILAACERAVEILLTAIESLSVA